MSYQATKGLMEQRRKLVEDARVILETAAKEKRSLATEEQTKYDLMFADVEAMTADINRHQKLAALGESAGLLVGEPANDNAPVYAVEPRTETPADLQKRAFNSFLRRGADSLSGDERRALNATTDSAGGYTSRRSSSWRSSSATNAVFMRQITVVRSRRATRWRPDVAADPPMRLDG